MNIAKEMGIPLRLRKSSFKSYDVKFNNHTKEVDEIQALAKNQKWIIISGITPGIGKTHLAVAAMGLSWKHDLCNDGEPYHPSHYLFMPMCDIGERVAMAGINFPDMLDDWEGRRCLLLDELGSETNKAIQRFEILFKHFYYWDKQIIATTSLTPDELASRYDGSIIDRIIECGSIVTLTGKSYRRK